MDKPLVLELKANSLDDGPGIRTAIFFKGCPLDCIWCHNPESKKTYAELSVAAEDCIGCFSCKNVCPKHAVGPDRPGILDRSLCDDCFLCTEVCPPKGLQRVGKDMTMEEIVKRCASDKPFFDVSGGGVTLTGGEPTMFTEWVGELCRKLSDAGLKIHIETCGMFNFEKVKELILPYISSAYMDVKIYDREAHRKYCGVPNDVILQNLGLMVEASKDMGFDFLPRTPLIPNITDTDENLESIADLYVKLGIKETELLPYNPTWYGKNTKLGLTLAPELEGLDKWQEPEKVAHCKGIFTDKGITCK
ncbi:MAG: glycyl-radical enzyme activating protein [Clostridia bacterium]|nr:glycyl-radical enzyme activating protein [Clostridia bacterium]MBQ3896874.1 glycyl-radical enzyme activating protein [Clostridia bacterium]